MFTLLYVTVGSGFSLSQLSAMVSILEHFDKHRGMATSLAASGLPVGNTLSPFITNFLLDTYGWRGCLIIHGGILLNTVVLAMTLWPVKVQQTEKVEPSVINFFKSLLKSFTMLKRKPVVFFSCAIFFMIFNIQTYYDHMPSRVVFLGYELNYAGLILSALGFGNLIGRLSCSVIMGFNIIDPTFALGSACLIQSMVSLIATAFVTFLPTSVMAGLFGFGQGKDVFFKFLQNCS